MTWVVNNGHDENGRYSGGKAGDQTGDECYIREDYDFGQAVFLVHPDDKVNDLVARMAVSQAKNDHCGYDQGQRTTYYTVLKANKWIVGGIKTDCESDCSSGVVANVIGAGNRLGDKKLAAVSKDCYTGNLKAALVAAGYKAYTLAQLKAKFGGKPKGCIQLNESRHVNTVVDGASNLPASCKTAAAKYAAGRYTTTVTALNVRTGPGTSYAIKTKPQLSANAQQHCDSKGRLVKGTAMDVSAIYLDAAGNTWGKIPSGYVCMEYKGVSRVKKA